MSFDISEIIPDDLPDWAAKAMAEGQLFNVTFDRIKKIESDNKIFREIIQEAGIDPDQWLGINKGESK